MCYAHHGACKYYPANTLSYPIASSSLREPGQQVVRATRSGSIYGVGRQSLTNIGNAVPGTLRIIINLDGIALRPFFKFTLKKTHDTLMVRTCVIDEYEIQLVSGTIPRQLGS